MKSYTDIEQSHKLSKILQCKSADMFYVAGKGEPIFIGNKMVAYGNNDYDALGGPDVLCWSLAALLDVLPESIADNRHELIAYMSIYKYDFLWVCAYDYENQEDGNYISFSKESIVDACYEMIIKLHELNLL